MILRTASNERSHSLLVSLPPVVTRGVYCRCSWGPLKGCWGLDRNSAIGAPGLFEALRTTYSTGDEHFLCME